MKSPSRSRPRSGSLRPLPGSAIALHQRSEGSGTHAFRHALADETFGVGAIQAVGLGCDPRRLGLAVGELALEGGLVVVIAEIPAHTKGISRLPCRFGIRFQPLQARRKVAFRSARRSPALQMIAKRLRNGIGEKCRRFRLVCRRFDIHRAAVQCLREIEALAQQLRARQVGPCNCGRPQVFGQQSGQAKTQFLQNGWGTEVGGTFDMCRLRGPLKNRIGGNFAAPLRREDLHGSRRRILWRHQKGISGSDNSAQQRETGQKPPAPPATGQFHRLVFRL
ncbi:hypothetical protein LWV33_00980 [Brucella intermedia]